MAIGFAAWCLSHSVALGQSPTPDPVEPVVAKANDEGQQQLSTFKLPSGWTGQLWAAEPLVANPVAFAIDEHGRAYVCESFRQEQGVTDNRSHDQNWVDHDLAAQTVTDRIAYHRELLPNAGAEYMRQDDRVRLLVDSDRDGQADLATVFANRLNDLEAGSIAGVLPVGDQVLVTCIPHLWRFRDLDGDGSSDERTSLQSGFGVRVAFRGHDLHGLIRGPDGRLYFSVGDRGYHLLTKEGRVLADAESGAVFRCELDGSGLEVFATGLRNPQELAFDDFGNLFTGDNNSDSGDRARWVFVLPGGDSGWRMAYQYLPDRGPFNREKIWQPHHWDHPAYVLPPVANIGDGPSGLLYYPGSGIDGNLQNSFLMCDFRGTPAMSGVRQIRLQTQGAFFKVSEDRELLWQILGTDLAIGPDGWLYVSDWVNGWVGENKGRLYRFGNQDVIAGTEATEVCQILNKGCSNETAEQVVQLLGHADQRVRLAAQFELVRRGEAALLRDVLLSDNSRLARLHGLWGLAQIARTTSRPDLAAPVVKLLDDRDDELRAQAAKVIGECGLNQAVPQLMALVRDRAFPRVQMHAALAFSHLVHPEPWELVNQLTANGDSDPALRHAFCMALANQDLKPLMSDPRVNPAEGMDDAAARGLVVALRRQRSPFLKRFLDWPSALVAAEAATAIHDLPIDECLSDLAGAADRFPDSLAFTHRGLNAAFRMGGKVNALRLADCARNPKFTEQMRREALVMLSSWAEPPPRDRVLGMWRPISVRSADDAKLALVGVFPQLVAEGTLELQLMAVRAAGTLGLQELQPSLVDLANKVEHPAELRSAAITAISVLPGSQFTEGLLRWSADSEPSVRSAAVAALVKAAPEEALTALHKAVDSMDVRERQAAWRLLCELPSDGARELVESKLGLFQQGNWPANTRLDFVSAARTHQGSSSSIQAFLREYDAPNAQDQIAPFRDSLEGGNTERGKQIFFEWASVSCLRCHRVADSGGYVGPDLSDIGLKKDRIYLMESIVDPNRTIAEKFETIVVLDLDGHVHSGIVNFEDQNSLRLLTPQGDMVTLDKESIEERRTGKSAMPIDLIRHLNPFDVRDLVEFLSEQKKVPDENEVESLERIDK